MTNDTIIGILGVGLGVAGLVPIILDKEQPHSSTGSARHQTLNKNPAGLPRLRFTLKTKAVAIICALIACIGVFWWVFRSEKEEWENSVTKAEDRIIEKLNKGPLTFEDIFDSAYYSGYDTLNSALDDLTDKRVITDEVQEVHANDNHVHKIRLFTLASQKQ
jgi:hypothetical protein